MPEKLQSLDTSGYRVCFVTNQAGIEKLKLTPDEIMTKINDIVNELNNNVGSFSLCQVLGLEVVN